LIFEIAHTLKMLSVYLITGRFQSSSGTYSGSPGRLRVNSALKSCSAMAVLATQSENRERY